ncbi:putative motility protein [Hydrogenimonas sp.]|uniref:putative motility protein n=1 Tax=Hydrogenimonas sp. TaxID=2231112 RepID=UPI0026136852|nr:putative motility protein [Hydrogenimonas sp.]
MGGNIGINNAALMQQIAVETMKKAMDIQAREVLSVLQSASSPQSTPSSSDVSRLTGLGQRIDLRV